MTAAALEIPVGASPRLGIATMLRNEFIPAANREDATWAARILVRLPPPLIDPVKRQYRDRYQRKNGCAEANAWLRDIGELLDTINFSLAIDDGEICTAAAEYAKRTARIVSGAIQRGADPLSAGSTYARSKGITPPEPDRSRTTAGCCARLTCPHWWRRQLRKQHGRAAETLARELNLVRKGRSCYASEAAVQRRASQKRRTRDMMEAMLGEARDAAGNVVHSATLADLHDASVSNPELRRGELMCRLRGFEEAAKIAGHEALFITVTAPGEYHRAYAKSGQPNPNWNGATPRQVHAYLQSIWTRTRAAWKREGVNVYGFRIAEPHHDGTCHWHLLLFVRRLHADGCLGHFREQAARAGVHVDGDNGRGFRVERIDHKRGSAVGYVAKYVAKNIDGHGLEKDLLDNPAAEAAQRIDAWASTWGIRQFQQFGGPSVTVWRELRRVRQEPAGLPGPGCLAWRAADSGRWRRFCRWGFSVRLLRQCDAGRANRYGDIARGVVVGIVAAGVSLLTRPHTWEFTRQVIHAVDRWCARQRATWTRVNNCTLNLAAQQPITRAGP